MKLVKTEKIETNKYKLEISVGAEEFESAIQNAYRKNVKNIAIPGFRKGKAPRKMVEKMYGTGVFYEDAINDLYPKAYSEAIDEAKLEPVDKAEIDMSDVDENGFSFTATVTVKPEVTVKDYKGVKAVKYVEQVTDAEIDAEVDKMRGRMARLVSVEDRAAMVGDTATIDFEGFLDGVPFEGGKGENFPLQLGEGHFIPGFEDQVTGHKPGEEFEVNVTFPETYGEATLAGKPAVFQCKMHELKKKELPELDDELAKDMSEFSTMEELRNDLREKLQTGKDKNAQNNVENDLIEGVIANMEAEIPQCMFERRIDQNVKEFEYRLQSQGMGIETYLSYTGMEHETFRKTFAEQAEKQVKIRLALEKIVELEQITVADEDIEKEFEKLAESYGIGAAEVKKMVSASDISGDLAVNKAIELVRESAVITEQEGPAPESAPEEKKAPTKKKAPAKKKAEEKTEAETAE